MQLCCTGKESVFHSIEGDDMNEILKIAAKNPKVDAEEVSEARKLLQILREQGISRPDYNLIPLFRRQMYVESKYGKPES